MFGWRKRNDGFEWREYVRTTILVRRKNRRERVGQAAKGAVVNLKAAGQRGAAAGAVGAQALGRGAVAAGQKGVVYGAAGIRAADSKLRESLPTLAARLRTFGMRVFSALVGLCIALLKAASWLWATLAPRIAAGWRRLEPAFAVLRRPNLSAPLAIAGCVAVLGALGRIATLRADRDAVIALLIGLAILGALIAARWSEGRPAWLDRWLENIGDRRRPAIATIARGAAAVAVLAIVAGGAVLAWRAADTSSGKTSGRSSSLQRAARDTSLVEGRAVAVSGDTLRVAGTTLRLSGIEAPVAGQTCGSAASGPWRCDTAAKAALARLAGRGRISCKLASVDDDGRRLATCHQGNADVAAELVRGGHVFASAGLFASYAWDESSARSAKAGVWGGDAERPSDYRAQKWEEAKREAPDGCPIKGHVKGGRRVYVLPWSQGYERVRVGRGKGERWFCSESEAREAGWTPSEQS